MPFFYSHFLQNPKIDLVKKAQILLNQFFAPPLYADLFNIKRFKYEQGFDPRNITIYIIRQLIFIAISNKVLGKEKFFNHILKSIIDLIFPYRYIIFNTCWSTGNCPTHLQLSITVVFQKPRKFDYTITKSYWLITFLNTIKKTLEFIIETRSHTLQKPMIFCPQITLGSVT